MIHRRLPVRVLATPLLLAAACASPDPIDRGDGSLPPAEDPAVLTPTADDSLSARSDEALAALEAGDFETAHAVLREILLERYLEEASELIDAEDPNPQDGLLVVDQALELDARNTEAMMLRGRGNAILGQQLIDRSSPGIYIQGAFEEALDAFESALPRLENTVAARFGAARAAYNLLRYEEALRHAQYGMFAIEEGQEVPELDPTPERTLAEVAYGAYTDALLNGSDEVRTRELFGIAEEALNQLLGREPGLPWAWDTLANLYLWDDRIEEAKTALKQGLDRAPDDANLLARLVDVSRSNGGLRAALLDINAFVNKHPDIAGGYWWLGRERFEVGLERLAENPAPTEDFEAAERAFVRARGLDPALTDACLGYEVNCRNGVGWAYYNADDLEAATAAFLSMNEVMPRGVEWLFEGRLLSGIQGLDFVGFRYNERGDWAGAAATYEVLRELQPDDHNWANNAAFFHRDHAVELEQIGKDLCRRSMSPPEDPAEVAQLLEFAALDESDADDLAGALEARAEEYLSRARATIEKSYEAYQDVERLAPDDVRLLNDSALVRVYYLYRDLDRAKELLETCIALGEEQLADPTLSEDDREALENAWGDAFQNMGYLYLVNLKQPDLAKPYFERCLGLGDPRPIVTGTLLPMCDGDPEHPQLVELRSWGRSCSEQRADREPTR